MLDCHDVAKYFLTKVNEEEGAMITHLKLQKLVYYAQSANLAFHDTPLFSQEILAWTHGPVVCELYQKYKVYGSSPLPPTESDVTENVTEPDRKIMDSVYVFFGQFAAWKLREMTHQETPWRDAYPTEGVISSSSMRDYFRIHWCDDLSAAIDTPEVALQKLLDTHWEPNEEALEAARRYKMGRVDGGRYRSEEN